MVALLCSSAGASGRGAASGEQADIKSLNAVLEQAFFDIPQSAVKADEALIDQVYERGSIPVIVRLRDADLPYGFFADRQRPRSENIAALQATVLDDMIACSRKEMQPLCMSSVSACFLPWHCRLMLPELEALLAHPNVIDIVEDSTCSAGIAGQCSVDRRGTGRLFFSLYGLGQAVAILDTGVDKNHPFLSGKVVSEACYSSNDSFYSATSVCPGGVTESTAVDSALNCDPAVAGCFHGTHVAGIAAGKNADVFRCGAKTHP